MKQINDYTQEELVSLYKRYSVYATTWWFKYYRQYKMKPEEKEQPFIQIKLDRYTNFSSTIGSPRSNVEFDNNISDGYCSDKIELLSKDAEKNHYEIDKFKCQQEALRVENRCLFWFCGGFDDFQMDYERLKDKVDYACSPEEIEEELHINDDSNISNGLATDYQIYEFVWETLQYLNIQQLTKLIKFADNGLKNRWETVSLSRGRKSRKCEIKQIDVLTGEVRNTYTTRNELMGKTGIQKYISHNASKRQRRILTKEMSGRNGKIRTANYMAL